ncbi:L-fuculokinase (plasmid) [Fulvitalea axinellae]|uniref:L-fuculokinase n=1 Tax=Fulvitalea axinellae TaxID=1182444 RepID=A0AAU9D9X3_9BACT|nr:L-fuculokinase [Fulvitalea axinellae]
MEEIVIVLDCGATNVRAVAVNRNGKLLASHSVPNQTRPDPNLDGGVIWDIDEIWGKFSLCAKEVSAQIDTNNVVGVTVTTFGVDGAPVKKDGTLLYPVISWQCERTVAMMESDAPVPNNTLYRRSGTHPFYYNTAYKLAWYKKNRPDILEEMDYYVFIPSLILHRLSGQWVTDVTMAGTSMLTDIDSRTLSENTLEAFGLKKEKFPPVAEPGALAGRLTKEAAEQTGLPENIAVTVAGHDTQFALFGAGAGENEAVLSSGTWEILMVRASGYATGDALLAQGVTTEFDSRPGLYNIGCQWPASGVLEWLKKTIFADLENDPDAYEKMISGAEKVPSGSNGVTFDPSFISGEGEGNYGSIKGLTFRTSRHEIYRAALESLAAKTKKSMDVLQNAGGFKAEALVCVGGGSKNRLWNQLRADALGIPVKLIDKKETTVLGAAMFAFAGAGVCASPEEALANVSFATEVYTPSEESVREDS